MAKFDKKIAARKLRIKGKSLAYIAKFLLVSKSSVSIWCRDVVLTEVQQKVLADKGADGRYKGRMLGAEMNREKKRKNISESKRWAKEVFYKFSERDMLIAGISLYWAEGSKTETTSGFLFVNSDPAMIKFMHDWLIDVMGIEKERIKPRLAINEIHEPRIGQVLKFWSDLLGVPIGKFKKPWYIKTKQKKIYSNYDSYFGVLRLGVEKSGKLKYKMLSLIEIIRDYKKLPA
ncbi:MAG: hypothetical protein COV70_01600 [Parcubacteria group bacterium CG11_big_fil_rev_8_21_14_0_20_39_22]|nr:MAG: hypothetical protein COV70_01600 [Parcubacteria group bacterium CG11_big_fil_rev_8_21_14_0_20_39_22]